MVLPLHCIASQQHSTVNPQNNHQMPEEQEVHLTHQLLNQKLNQSLMTTEIDQNAFLFLL
jgi:hypothetical protein